MEAPITALEALAETAVGLDWQAHLQELVEHRIRTLIPAPQMLQDMALIIARGVAVTTQRLTMMVRKAVPGPVLAVYGFPLVTQQAHRVLIMTGLIMLAAVEVVMGYSTT
jgi:hypothetical protein